MSLPLHKPHPSRPATAFWTPPAAVAVLTLLLVLLWPHRPRRHAAAGLPEPGAAFVVAARMPYIGPIMPGVHGFGPTRSSLDETTSEAPHPLPAPEYRGIRPLATWMPAAVVAPSDRPPDLARRPVGPLLPESFPAPTGGCEIALSAGLQNAGFAFGVPVAAVTGAAVVARFHVEVGDDGRVLHLLAESSDNPAASRLLESAVSTGRASRACFGEIQVSCGR